jgi:hypothetical protein
VNDEWRIADCKWKRAGGKSRGIRDRGAFAGWRIIIQRAIIPANARGEMWWMRGFVFVFYIQKGTNGVLVEDNV